MGEQQSIRSIERVLTAEKYQQLHDDIMGPRYATPWQGSTVGALYEKFQDNSVAEYYNQPHIDPTTEEIWVPDMDVTATIRSVKGEGEWEVILEAHRSLWTTLTQQVSFDATDALFRDNLNWIFPQVTCPVTFANIMALAKRTGTYAEVLYSADPVQGARVTDIYGYRLVDTDVTNARIVNAQAAAAAKVS